MVADAVSGVAAAVILCFFGAVARRQSDGCGVPGGAGAVGDAAGAGEGVGSPAGAAVPVALTRLATATKSIQLLFNGIYMPPSE